MSAPIITNPEPGFYWTRLVSGGPRVAARIWRPCSCTVNGGDDQNEHDWSEDCDRYPRLQCVIAGKPRNPVYAWPGLAGRIIDKAEFDYLVSTAEWAGTYAPSAPEADPHKRIDLANQPSLF